MKGVFAAAEELARQGRWDELDGVVDSEPRLTNLTDERGRTLLIACAGFGGSAAILAKLIQNGADPNHRSHTGSTALAAAIVGGSRHGLTTLPELKTLLDLGADPEAIADSGMPALHWAIAQHRPEHVEVLLKHGARLETLTSDDPPESVYDVARRVGSSESVRLLEQRFGKNPGKIDSRN